MKHSLFRQPLPLAILWNFLDKICVYNEDYYYIDKNVYLKMMSQSDHLEFIESLKPFYYKCKHHYLTRPIDYYYFITLLRQICNYSSIPYKTTKKYENSDPVICYFIERPL